MEESSPPTEEGTLEPFVSETSPEGEVVVGFSEPVDTTEGELAEGEFAVPPPERRLRQKLMIRDENDPSEIHEYEVFKTIEMSLTSTLTDEIEPISVDWSLKSFDGYEARLQMDLDALYAEDIDISAYDNLEITFNDGTNMLTSADGKYVGMGKKVQWKLQPMVKQETTSKFSSISSIWLALISLALTISFILALFQGSLLPTWMLINSL